MARTVIAGNWKMNKTIGEAVAFAAALRKALADKPDLPEIVIAPPFTALHAVSAVISGSAICLAAQNMHEAEKGAFTGEISGVMLREAGCSSVIIGHSERRTFFGETNERLNKKLSSALGTGLNPIFCIGETLQEREENRMEEVIGAQLKEGLNNLDDSDIRRILIAYEPVWAIGTGRTATPAQAQEIHAFIRQVVDDMMGDHLSAGLQILYGGTVNPGKYDRTIFRLAF